MPTETGGFKPLHEMQDIFSPDGIAKRRETHPHYSPSLYKAWVIKAEPRHKLIVETVTGLSKEHILAVVWGRKSTSVLNYVRMFDLLGVELETGFREVSGRPRPVVAK